MPGRLCEPAESNGADLNARQEKVREALIAVTPPRIAEWQAIAIAAALAEVEEWEREMRRTQTYYEEANDRADAAEAEADRLKAALTEIADPDGRHSKRAAEIARAALAPADRNTT